MCFIALFCGIVTVRRGEEGVLILARSQGRGLYYYGIAMTASAELVGDTDGFQLDGWGGGWRGWRGNWPRRCKGGGRGGRQDERDGKGVGLNSHYSGYSGYSRGRW